MRRASSSVDLSTAGVLSIAAHTVVALLVVGVVKLVSGSRDPLFSDERPHVEDSTDPAIEIELPKDVEQNNQVAKETAPVTPPDPPRPSGGSDPRPDTGARGRGGDDHVSERALNLADRDDGLSRDRSVLSRIDRSQLPRIHAGSERRSREDWRASRDPMEVTFFVMGSDGREQERRIASESDPGSGARRASRRDSAGTETLGKQSEPDGSDSTEARLGSDRTGGALDSSGVGVRNGSKQGPESERAKLADGRPLVDPGTPSVAANDQGKPLDTLDSEQEVAARTQSIIHASTAGGQTGAGRGGQDGPGRTGSGGERGAGSLASPMGAGGSGPPDPNEAARISYVRSVLSKVQPLWTNAFPRQAIIDGLEGTAIIRFVIDSSGRVTGATVARSSGIPVFDENVRQAVLRGAPYGPLPQALLPRLNMTIPFTAKNPAVRPKDPKEGIAER